LKATSLLAKPFRQHQEMLPMLLIGIWRSEARAATLEAIAQTNAVCFYRRDIAERIAAFLQVSGVRWYG
jgi:gamma-glutamyltranspeptidase